MAAPFDISLPGVSKRLRVLERAKLITRRKEGRVDRCRLVAEAMKEAAQWIGHSREGENPERQQGIVEGLRSGCARRRNGVDPLRRLAGKLSLRHPVYNFFQRCFIFVVPNRVAARVAVGLE